MTALPNRQPAPTQHAGNVNPVATAHRPRPIWVTSIVDNADHAITHDNMAAGITARTGTYRALCRATVIPPAMTEPPRARCPYCTAILRNPK